MLPQPTTSRRVSVMLRRSRARARRALTHPSGFDQLDGALADRMEAAAELAPLVRIEVRRATRDRVARDHPQLGHRGLQACDRKRNLARAAPEEADFRVPFENFAV